MKGDWVSCSPDSMCGKGRREGGVVGGTNVKCHSLGCMGMQVNSYMWTASSAHHVWALKKPFGHCQV